MVHPQPGTISPLTTLENNTNPQDGEQEILKNIQEEGLKDTIVKIAKEINHEGEQSLGRQKISIMAAVQAISNGEINREEIKKLAEDYMATINKAEQDVFHATQTLNFMINSI